MFKKKRLHELGEEGDPTIVKSEVAASDKTAKTSAAPTISQSGRLNYSERQISMTSTASAANDLLADSHSSNIFEESKLMDRPAQVELA